MYFYLVTAHIIPTTDIHYYGIFIKIYILLQLIFLSSMATENLVSTHHLLDSITVARMTIFLYNVYINKDYSDKQYFTFAVSSV